MQQRDQQLKQGPFRLVCCVDQQPLDLRADSFDCFSWLA
jgi:hypothetical protein